MRGRVQMNEGRRQQVGDGVMLDLTAGHGDVECSRTRWEESGE